MATTTQVLPRTLDNLTLSISTLNLGTYATGGVSVTPSQLGLSNVMFAIISVHSLSATPTGTWYRFDPDTNKVIAYQSSGSDSEVPNATDLSATTLRITAFGA